MTRPQKKPRVNTVNRKNVEVVWGDEHRKDIAIPLVIDDYNHWMLGVDVADQLIAYYHFAMRCRRTWMPIMFHCLDVLRINGYIALKGIKDAYPGADKNGHKTFLFELIQALIKRAQESQPDKMNAQATRARTAMADSAKRSKKPPVLKISSKDPWSSIDEFQRRGDEVPHCLEITETQGRCVWC